MSLPDTRPTIQTILDEVYRLEQSIGGIDHSKFEAFLKSSVNGDEFVIIDCLVIPATFGEKNEDCIIIYILTKGKLIKIRISKDQTISSSAYLNQITGVNKSVIEGANQRNSVSVEYPNGVIGLTYGVNDEKIDKFFQKVDREVQGLKA